MVFFPDNRGKFAGRAPWEFAPGTPSPNNLSPAREVKTTPATRVADEMVQDEKGNWIKKEGSHNPRRDFRKMTAENPPIPKPSESLPEPSLSPQNPEYSYNESLKKSKHDRDDSSQKQGPLPRES